VAPPVLLALVIGAAAVLSAVFSNDIVCLAMAPVLLQACVARRLDPVPFLLALACAANIGSAATLIGNPQNMLIGEVLGLSFGAYALDALPVVAASLVLTWAWLRRSLPPQRAASAGDAPAADAGQGTPVSARADAGAGTGAGAAPAFDAWQSAKGLAVAGALMLVFLFTDWPREVATLVGAGLLLLSRRFHTREVTALIDWDLLVLFMSLFVVNHALAQTGMTAAAVAALQAQGLDLARTGVLFGATLALSNAVSNVPAVMLLLPHLQGDASGVTLALVSTFAGNLLLVGSIANLIVVDLALQCGIGIDWKQHARIGIPVTLGTLAIVWAWMH
jgi:Na+/H+ antiporter NhaD/arsenite permease-like protein